MFQKINLALLSTALLFSVTAWAKSSDEDMEKMSYCYGVYAATKDKSEVSKSNAFLKTAGDGSLYGKLADNKFYREGYRKASTLAKKGKSSCYMMVYGFLGVGYSMVGPKDTKTDLDLAYCMGYVNEARATSDSEMIQEFCDTEKNLTSQKKIQCVSELTQILKRNTKYQTGRKEAISGTINPVRVMNCGMKLTSASEADLDKAMGTHQNTPQTVARPTSPPKNAAQRASRTKTSPQRNTPKKRKDTITKPIFR